MTRLYVFSIIMTPLSALATVRAADPLVASLRDPAQGFSVLAFGIAIGILGVLITKGKLFQFLFCTLLALISAACFAPVIPVPNEFENGQAADANQVNANFDALATQIADHVDNDDVHASEENLITLEPDGSVSIKAPGASTGIYLRPSGDIEITDNTITVNAGANANINAGISMTTNAGVNTSVNSGGDIEMLSNGFSVTAISDMAINAGQNITSDAGAAITMNAVADTTVSSGGNTSLNSAGAISIQGATIDLN